MEEGERRLDCLISNPPRCLVVAPRNGDPSHIGEGPQIFQCGFAVLGTPLVFITSPCVPVGELGLHHAHDGLARLEGYGANHEPFALGQADLTGHEMRKRSAVFRRFVDPPQQIGKVFSIRGPGEAGTNVVPTKACPDATKSSLVIDAAPVGGLVNRPECKVPKAVVRWPPDKSHAAVGVMNRAHKV